MKTTYTVQINERGRWRTAFVTTVADHATRARILYSKQGFAVRITRCQAKAVAA